MVVPRTLLSTRLSKALSIQPQSLLCATPLRLLRSRYQTTRSSLLHTTSLSSRFNAHTTVGSTLFLRPYHISIRSLDQRHSADTVAPPGAYSYDTDNHDPKSSAPSSTDPILDDGIQPQHKNPIPPNTDPKARMLIGFTCTVCNHRSHKTMSKHAYTHGVVIMQCDHCKNRHLIADHLGWFKNGGVTVEDLVKERGETVQKLTKSYQLVKDGEVTITAASISETATGAGVGVDEKVKVAKTELEIALEKAAEGMLEWIPKEVLQQEEERMRKSLESIDHSKKTD
ncbi:hypothetical protein BGZ51_006117 [Haplosporangium sp. Z 767]|nr:hypothetical protein BGZ51_006117 [Haplosporangium sp. Z 767]KAF9180705.1 hypothetical protein BGZ50_006039 [Haplosporangium sp. Z 11]